MDKELQNKINLECWKQPTAVSWKWNDNLRLLDRILFCYIWQFVRYEDGVETFTHNGKNYDVELKRGQCIFKVQNVSSELNIDRRTVRKSVERLSKWYSEMYIKGKPYGLLLTFKHVDDLFFMYSETDTGSTSSVHQAYINGTSKKSVKTDKTVKSVRGPDFLKDGKGDAKPITEKQDLPKEGTKEYDEYWVERYAELDTMRKKIAEAKRRREEERLKDYAKEHAN